MERLSGIMNDCCSKIKCGVGAGEKCWRGKNQTSDVLPLERIELEEGGVC